MIFELFKVQKRKVSELFLSGGYTFLKNSAKDSTIEKKKHKLQTKSSYKYPCKCLKVQVYSIVLAVSDA